MPGETAADPYRVWLSEVMLQQTTVAAVTPRFERFLARWPTVESLAAAEDQEVLSEWAGLGYYARARNLIACAREVAAPAEFPDTEEELRKLPGIGAYTAAAIAAIAFGGRALVMDTNVERVVARLQCESKNRSPSAARIREMVEAMTPKERPGDFAQAMMDLGATICRPKAPDAPLSAERRLLASCIWRARTIPRSKAKAVRPRDMASPTGSSEAVASGWSAAQPRACSAEWRRFRVRTGPTSLSRRDRARPSSHVFTHFRLELAVVASDRPTGEGWWQPLDGLVDAGLPTLYRRAVEIGT